MKHKEALEQITYFVKRADGSCTVEYVWSKRLAKHVRKQIGAQRVSKTKIAEWLRDELVAEGTSQWLLPARHCGK